MSTTKKDDTKSPATAKEDPQAKSEEQPHRITENILRQSVAKEAGVEPDNVNILTFEVKAGSKPGDGFACDMKRVIVQAEVDFAKGKKESKEYIYVVKCIPMSASRAYMLKETNVFQKECVAYSDIVPNLNKLKKDGKNEIPVAKTLFVSEEEGVIVMEDLRLSNFYLGDKRKGLNLKQIKLILHGLSNFHSTSYHWMHSYTGGYEQFKQNHPNLIQKYWFDDNNKTMKEMVASMLVGIYNLFLQVVTETCQEDYPDMVAALKKHSDRRYERFLEAQAHDEADFNVILHNDSWCNNFMFRNDANGQPAELKILDMQLLRIASPVIDLVYFFGSSTAPDLRKKELDNLLKYYHDNLISNLTSFGYNKDVFTFEQLKKEYKRRFLFGFGVSHMHTQLQFAPEDNPTGGFEMDSLEMSDPVKGEEMLKKMNEFQLNNARKNEELKARYIEQAREAYQMGIL